MITAFLILTVQDAAAESYRAVPYRAHDYGSYERAGHWYLDPAEIRWLRANWRTALEGDVRLSATEGQGVRLDFIRPGSFLDARGFLQGDVVAEIILLPPADGSSGARPRRLHPWSPTLLPQILDELQRADSRCVLVQVRRHGEWRPLVFRALPIET